MDRGSQGRLYGSSSNPWDYESFRMHTPGSMRYGPMGMSHESMHRRGVMHYEYEVSRLQTEISRLQEQLMEMGLDHAGLDTPIPKQEEVIPKEFFPPIPEGRQEGNVHLSEQTEKRKDRNASVKSEEGDHKSSFQSQVRTHPLTSTPKPETSDLSGQIQATYNDNKGYSPGVKKPTGIKIKPATYDGTRSWLD